MTETVHNLLKDHNILISLVPNNMTHIFQPLDLTVNSGLKSLKKKNTLSGITARLEKGLTEDKINVKTQLITMKPSHAKSL